MRQAFVRHCTELAARLRALAGVCVPVARSLCVSDSVCCGVHVQGSADGAHAMGSGPRSNRTDSGYYTVPLDPLLRMKEGLSEKETVEWGPAIGRGAFGKVFKGSPCKISSFPLFQMRLCILKVVGVSVSCTGASCWWAWGGVAQRFFSPFCVCVCRVVAWLFTSHAANS